MKVSWDNGGVKILGLSEVAMGSDLNNDDPQRRVKNMRGLKTDDIMNDLNIRCKMNGLEKQYQ